MRRSRASLNISALAFGLCVSSALPGAAAPIQIVFDCHADPMPNGAGSGPQQVYQDWVDAANWLLDLTEPRGAKLSFLSAGQFMEWILEDSVEGWPLMQRLYASGGQIGTHSHTERKFGTHDWRNITGSPTPAVILQQWNDHVAAVNAVIAAALGVTDADQVRAINCSRGAHLPSNDAQRIQLMADFGFSLHQQGPDEMFYAWFRHYPMNPFRPSGAEFLAHDPDGPVVLVPFGPALGKNDVHFGINQDMRTPAVQARFLLEVLNWLQDVHIRGAQRVGVTGWGGHPSDVMPGAPSRNEYPPMLDWLDAHFVGQPVGGQVAAEYSSSIEARDLYTVWETTHPGEASFSYAEGATDWDEYPYLMPAARYLFEAQYVAPMPAQATVRWHSLTAAAAAGGPYTFYVAYPTDGSPAAPDLSISLGSGTVAVVSPATGRAELWPTSAVPVPAPGTMLVPVSEVLNLIPRGDYDDDGDVDNVDYSIQSACLTGPNGGVIAGCDTSNLDLDTDVDLLDFAGFQAARTGP